jgi:peptidoglycan/xylan/chitin deacetylase (PgdA/CDA1 family)
VTRPLLESHLSVLAKAAARRLLGPLGYTAGLRRRYRHAVRILMYHRFPASNHLEAQCEHLKKHYHPISLTEAAESLRSGKSPPGAVVFTVDDGYRDFVDAYPILKAHSIPALVYVVTDLPDHNSWLWTDRLTHYLKRTGGVESATDLKRRLKRMPDQERRAYLDSLPGFDCAPPPEFTPLTWDDIRLLAEDGVEFGAHTRSHPILSSLPDRHSVEDEIAGSKRRIELEIGAPIRHFCYPNGKPADYSLEVIDVVREAGFETAATTIVGINSTGADPFRLQRIPGDPTHTLGRFAHAVAGFHRY